MLGVEHCVKVTDLGMASCVNHLAHLNFLSLDGCEDVASSSIYAITGQLSNLLDLYVNCCPLITDQEVANLTKACKKVSLTVCPSLYLIFVLVEKCWDRGMSYIR